MQAPLSRQGCDPDQYSFQSQRKAVLKNVQTTVQLNSFYMLVRLCSKSFKLGFNWGIPDVQGGFRKGKDTSDQIANICWIIEKAREYQNIYFCFIGYTKPLTVWITTNCGKFLKRWEYQTTLPASWETRMQVKKQQLEPDVEQGVLCQQRTL